MTREYKIVVVGEGMVELSGTARRARLGYGGDTLNTAIHLTRFGLPTAYFTALGNDQFSKKLRSDWSVEGLDTNLVLTDPDRGPGLYAIHTDHRGERSFTYWRSQSAARRMFELEGSSEAFEQAQGAQLLYFSLISLAILPPRGRAQLLDLACRVKERGGQVAFDSNYRAQLWSNADQARRLRHAAISLCDVGLPTLEDERQLSALCTPQSVADDWQSRGVKDVVVKMGSEGAFVDGRLVPPSAYLMPVDSTGAGDAFNAGYLAARAHGASPTLAAVTGNALAGWVVMRAGAIPPPDEAAPYRLRFARPR